MFWKITLLKSPCKKKPLWSGKMIKITKKLKELEGRIEALEKALKVAESKDFTPSRDQISYKEVLEEWLNGKKTT